ncbi:MAG TPA: FAD-dependent oxidoreductase [Pseudolabrys sp.]|jgi:fumarate reductase flavoprotein subunit
MVTGHSGQGAATAEFETRVPLVIVGAGAAGLCAALAAREFDVDAVVIERDAAPAGSTALSAGLIPAAGTRFQHAKDIDDSPERFADDIRRKANGEADPALVAAVALGAGPVVEWLAEQHKLPFDLIDDFAYPGHSALRMHGLPSRTGQELVDRLRNAAETNGVVILTERVCEQLFADSDGCIRGVEMKRRDGEPERIGCDALILACNGFGGNPELVRRHIPELSGALYFGHPGNRGDAIRWGEQLDADLRHLSSYQGHGSVATPHNILISWAVIMQGGFQVNREGRRFSDETQGYSEQAEKVLRQPGTFAWNVFDGRIAQVARQFEDFRAAERAGAILVKDTVIELANAMRVPVDVFVVEWEKVQKMKLANAEDEYGRRFITNQSLSPPYLAVKVTGALFHTQGGLSVDPCGRVKRKNGKKFPNLFAAGGAAVGVSGSTAAGYLSGNGLLTATVVGHAAGKAAAEQIGRLHPDPSVTKRI